MRNPNQLIQSIDSRNAIRAGVAALALAVSGAATAEAAPTSANVINYGGVAPQIASAYPPGKSGLAPFIQDATGAVHLPKGHFDGFIGTNVKPQ
ncbi:MAG: hypothetical protein ACR2FM_02495 [Candidatus Saccharimonadales bacterium]